MSNLRINISKLPEGVHHYTLETDAADLELDERFSDSITVKTELTKTINQILLQAEIVAKATMICDRCLEPFDEQITESYTMVYLFEGRGTANMKKEDEIELHLISPEANLIDIGDDVRQFLLLGVPLKVLCSDGCKGLCAHCGTNLNKTGCDCVQEETDSRWDDLKKMKFS